MKLYKKIRLLSPYIRREIGRHQLRKHEMYSKGFVFIHVPKAAGTSISKSLRIQDPGHYLLSEYKGKLPYTFAFVRDPWDRIASTFYYAKRHSIKYPYSSVSFVSKYNSLNDFVKEWVNEENVNKHYFFRTSFDYISIDNRVAVDFVGKFENLASDFKILCRDLGVDVELPHENKNISLMYREVYDLRSAEIVKRVYKDDVEYFSYSF